LSDLLLADLCEVGVAMKENEALYPVYLGVFRPQTIVAKANRGARLIE
jgi:hypothetical protein